MNQSSNLFIRLIGLGLIIVLLASCIRYPEDPEVIREDPATLITKRWRVDKVLKNNVEDITDSYRFPFFNFLINNKFESEIEMYQISVPPFGRDTVVSVPIAGDWEFLNEQSELDIIYDIEFTDPYNDTVVYGESGGLSFAIQRMTESELWLSNDSLRLELSN